MAVAAGASYLEVGFAVDPRLADRALPRELVAATGQRPLVAVMSRAVPAETRSLRGAGIRGAHVHGEPPVLPAAEPTRSGITIGVIAHQVFEVVEVSSGVEFLPGPRDPQRIFRFVEAVVGHHTPS
ncbi:MAG: hypothetical protein ABJC74_05475 [Gemmatimonadota bacterium]